MMCMHRLRSRLMPAAFLVCLLLTSSFSPAACQMQLRTICIDWGWFGCNVYGVVNSHCAGICPPKTPFCVTMTDSLGYPIACPCV